MTSAESYVLWFRLLGGDADQASGWLDSHGLDPLVAYDGIGPAYEADHEEALRLDGDRNLLLLQQLRRRRPGLSDRCRCDWLGEGTPEHEASPMCRSLRPDADRDMAVVVPRQNGKSNVSCALCGQPLQDENCPIECGCS